MGSAKISTVTLAFSFILGCSFLPGCSEKSSAPPPAPPQKTVFDPLTQQLDKARNVQAVVDDNAAATRQAVDSQGRGDSQERGDSSQ